MAQATNLGEANELMLVVERLAAQDQGRIVRIIDLLRLAPDSVREQTQKKLKDLIAREPQTHAECLALIDRIIIRAERELENELRLTGRVGDPAQASDGEYGFAQGSS